MEFVGVALRAAGAVAASIVVGSVFWASTAVAANTVPSAPRSVEARPGPAAVVVTWRSPRSDGGSRVDGYKVVRSAAGIPKKVTSVSARKRSLALRGLVPGKAYAFEVLAHNSHGWGKGSSAENAKPLAESGFGTITGRCGVVAPRLGEATSSFFENRFDFGDDWHLERGKLTEGGQRIFDSSDVGGSSTESEIMAYEALDRCESALLLKTTSEVVYEASGGNATTDFLVEIAGSKVGVTVTRAFRPPSLVFSQADADEIVADKLADIQESSQRVSDADAWVKQVLLVLAVDDAHADKIETAWHQASTELKGDTLLYLFTTDGADGFIYCNPDAAACQ